MQVKALSILLGDITIGTLLRYDWPPGQPSTRFVPDEAFIRRVNPPLISLSMKAADPESQQLLWRDLAAPQFNGRPSATHGTLLPPFFQGLLPEGVLRDHIAHLRGCDPTDHFEMLAACGRDLPGNIHARPTQLDPSTLMGLISTNETLDQDWVAEPMQEGVSVSGIQPKIGVLKDGERYVARTRLQDSRVIAKLPVVGYPRLPELEYTSLQLAGQAGINICHAVLEPLHKLAASHGFDLGEADQSTLFLAVTRFDRAPGKRIHVEDFGQIMSIAPEDKYTSSYLEIAAIMMGEPSLGEAAVHELLRRIAVNELLGNPDMHLKNIGVIYPDERTPILSPAYDIVGYSAYHGRHGHALHLLPRSMQPPPSQTRSAKPAKPGLSPLLVRRFCSALGIAEKPAAGVIRRVVEQAVKAWPATIQHAPLTERQKSRLIQHLASHPMVISLLRCSPKLSAPFAAHINHSPPA